MIDVDHQISAVERRVGTRSLEPGEARVVTISQTYTADLEDVWDAVTNPERIPRWFLPVTGDLRLGGHYQLEGNAGGTIERCEPPTAFDATWEYGGEVTWIEVRLEAVGAGRTRLQLEHIAHVDDSRWAEFGPGAVGVGWDLTFTGLGIHLDTRETLDPKVFEAWTGSDDGRRFMTNSSDAWCKAAVAAGEDPTPARAAADRTIAAYTGSDHGGT
jgi:uncharacterized protein YndB with AHSA1/START domain